MSSAERTGDHLWRRASQLPGVADVTMSFEVGDLHVLRSTLTAHASLVGAPDEQIEQLVIVAVELATNAIRHGGGRGELRMWHADGALYCQVSDEGPGMPDPTVGTTPPDPTRSDAHRGLWICRNLTRELHIQPNAGGRGLTITAVIGAPADRHG